MTDDESKTPSDELKEAASHLRSAASLLWERATKDPTALRATERIVTEVSERAEPIAKQVSTSVLQASKVLLDWAVPPSSHERRSPGEHEDGAAQHDEKED